MPPTEPQSQEQAEQENYGRRQNDIDFATQIDPLGSLIGARSAQTDQTAQWANAYLDLCQATISSTRRVTDMVALNAQREELVHQVVLEVIPALRQELMRQMRQLAMNPTPPAPRR